VLRAVVQIAFPPAFIYSDAHTYLGFVDQLTPSPDRTVGYGVLLRVLSWLTRDVSAVAITQHVLGLVTAVVIYVLLRRWEVSAVVATAATLPVLLDEIQLVLEHSVLSDVLFDLLIVLSVLVLAWRRPPGIWRCAAAGALFGICVLVRVAGEPVVLAAAIFCLVTSATLRARLINTVALCVAFVIPLACYARWYHSEEGAWALSQSGGRALYMRTTGFVDCSRLSLPSYEQKLCPSAPVGQRKDPTFYGWHDPNGSHGLDPPAGVTPDEAMHDFAVTAISTQPWDYARIVARDFWMTFHVPRTDEYEYEGAEKWNFARYVDYQPTASSEPVYLAHGGELPSTRQPFANLLTWYGDHVYVWGPLLLLLLLVAILGLIVPRPGSAPKTRPLTFLTTSLAVGLVLVPDLTAQFTWRYELPTLVLLPMAAALGWTRLRGRSQPGTTATPSTD
jgi:hypothetical protein